MPRDRLGQRGTAYDHKVGWWRLLASACCAASRPGRNEMVASECGYRCSTLCLWSTAPAKTGLQHRVAGGAFILGCATLHKRPAVKIEARSRSKLHNPALKPPAPRAVCATPQPALARFRLQLLRTIKFERTHSREDVQKLSEQRPSAPTRTPPEAQQRLEATTGSPPSTTCAVFQS